ncbi:putative RecB family exonuclease [Pseudonocardia sediminis]|uniref:Putative RecB family exonuclease n=1 Tax=Pseudonocardia sediminis TaxID=1397368 RepID=A0A4V6MEB7_PSEST|nr:RecB family exonuclease [Pseudonocardia sediminis]RZT86360.1 putative RecB family exonuclease [Pseudonocardia sediminis]
MDSETPAGSSAEAPERPRRRPALSPSRASDFRRCPLLYRFRAVDKLPETPTRAQVRGTLVHAVLEKLFALPAPERVPEAARSLLGPAWDELVASWPEVVTLLFTGPEDPALALWLDSATALLDTYFTLEDPRAVTATSVEELVEVDLTPDLPLRGYLDRLDVAPDGAIRVVDYKTGASPHEYGELRAMFQLKFYALAVLLMRGVVPAELRLLYLANGESLTYSPDADELHRFATLLQAIWAAVQRAAPDGDFRPNRGPACRSCDHKAVCPAWDGTPPPYPGWPTGPVDVGIGPAPGAAGTMAGTAPGTDAGPQGMIGS